MNVLTGIAMFTGELRMRKWYLKNQWFIKEGF